MSESAYYLGAGPLLLDKEEDKARLIQRLRQYLELRKLTVLVGNGCSLPLGSPTINKISNLIPEIDAAPYCLADQQRQTRARALLDELVTDKSSLGSRR